MPTDRRISFVTAEFRGYDPTARTVEGYSMTRDEDRYGDIIEPRGWSNVDEFMANPQVFWNHDWDNTVANVTDAQIEDNGIRESMKLARTKFVSEFLEPLLADNMLHAMSFAFDPLEESPRENGGMHITKWAKYESSIVSIPANPAARLLMAKKLGFRWTGGEDPPDPNAVIRHHADDGTLDVDALKRGMYQAITGARNAGDAGDRVRQHLAEHYAEVGLVVPSFAEPLEWPNDEKGAFETADVCGRLSAAASSLRGADSIMRHWAKGGGETPPDVVSALQAVREASQDLLRIPEASRDLALIQARLGTTSAAETRRLIASLTANRRNVE